MTGIIYYFKNTQSSELIDLTWKLMYSKLHSKKIHIHRVKVL